MIFTLFVRVPPYQSGGALLTICLSAAHMWAPGLRNRAKEAKKKWFSLFSLPIPWFFLCLVFSPPARVMGDGDILLFPRFPIYRKSKGLLNPWSHNQPFSPHTHDTKENKEFVCACVASACRLQKSVSRIRRISETRNISRGGRSSRNSKCATISSSFFARQKSLLRSWDSSSSVLYTARGAGGERISYGKMIPIIRVFNSIRRGSVKMMLPLLPFSSHKTERENSLFFPDLGARWRISFSFLVFPLRFFFSPSDKELPYFFALCLTIFIEAVFWPR